GQEARAEADQNRGVLGRFPYGACGTGRQTPYGRVGSMELAVQCRGRSGGSSAEGGADDGRDDARAGFAAGARTAMTVRRAASRETINAEVAARLEEVAHLLHEQDANPFRVEAYRRAAETVRGLPESVAAIYRHEGLEGLDRLPTIGPAIARAIRDIVLTGELPLLERL